jgi:hypothetical protein
LDINTLGTVFFTHGDTAASRKVSVPGGSNIDTSWKGRDKVGISDTQG